MGEVVTSDDDDGDSLFHAKTNAVMTNALPPDDVTVPNDTMHVQQ